MDLLEKFAPKKKKNFGINQCGEKGGGGYYIPTGKGRKKKILLLTNVGKKAGGYYIPAGKGRWGYYILVEKRRKKKKKKTLVLIKSRIITSLTNKQCN
jgi:hypothetical protein